MNERQRERRAGARAAHSLSCCDPDRPPAEECFVPNWFDSSLDLRAGLDVIEWTLPGEGVRPDAQSAP